MIVRYCGVKGVVNLVAWGVGLAWLHCTYYFNVLILYNMSSRRKLAHSHSPDVLPIDHADAVEPCLGDGAALVDTPAIA